jgi:hypothetical protein
VSGKHGFAVIDAEREAALDLAMANLSAFQSRGA